jgi:Icc protein
MPYVLPSQPVSRRRFLLGTLAAGTAAVALPHWATAAGRSIPSSRVVPAAAAPDPDRVALLSDVHIAANPHATSRGVNMYENLWRAGEEVASSGFRPAATLVTGDLSVTAGKVGDYATFAKAITPLRAAGMPPLYLGMGNHDHFGRFHQAFPATPGVVAPSAAKNVTVVETARANLLLLDSLGKTNSTPGSVGSVQLSQLAADLDARRDKPAIVLVHHQPCDSVWNTGLTDTAAFYNVIVPRRQVKAVVFGHTHIWSAARHEGINLINLPPTAFVFSGRDPNGWVDLLMKDNGATFTLHALDKSRGRDGERFDVTWRTERA